MDIDRASDNALAKAVKSAKLDGKAPYGYCKKCGGKLEKRGYCERCGPQEGKRRWTSTEQATTH